MAHSYSGRDTRLPERGNRSWIITQDAACDLKHSEEFRHFWDVCYFALRTIRRWTYQVFFTFFFTRVYFTAQWCIVDLYFSFQPNSSLWLHWLKVVSVDSWNIFSNISLIKKSLICTICHHNSPVFGSSTEVHLGNSRLEGFAGRICSSVL